MSAFCIFGPLTMKNSDVLPASIYFLARIFCLSYFLLPPSPVLRDNTVKQCLHYDPGSKVCPSLRRVAKSLEKAFTALDDLLNIQDWDGVVL
jgi:DnaJ family protein C protein 3